jgi:hypothetical protein
MAFKPTQIPNQEEQRTLSPAVEMAKDLNLTTYLYVVLIVRTHDTISSIPSKPS